MPNSGYVKKSSVRWLVTSLVVLLLLTNGIGLTIVRNQARDYAAAQAVRITKAGNEAVRYANNHTTCGLRAFVNPSLEALKKTEARSIASSKDLSLPASSRKRSKAAADQAGKQITQTKKLLAIFGTVPVGFKCETLPKTPPPFTTK